MLFYSGPWATDSFACPTRVMCDVKTYGLMMGMRILYSPVIRTSVFSLKPHEAYNKESIFPGNKWVFCFLNSRSGKLTIHNPHNLRIASQ